MKMGNGKKNILMIIPNFGFGGAERSFSNVSLELAKFHNLFVVAFNAHADHTYPHGGKVLDLGVEAGINVFDKLSKFRERIKKVKQIKHEFAIDVSISFLEGADYVNLLSKNKEKVIISIRGSKSFDGEISGLLGKIRKNILIPYLYRRADRIITLSEGLKFELVHHFGQQENKIETIYNFFDIETISNRADEPLEDEYLPLFKHPVIINTGRLHIQKQQKGLLQVYASLPVDSRGKLVFIGEGPLLQELLSLTRNLGLKLYWWGQPERITDHDEVYFLGFQENPFKFMKKATLFAFTSSWEGFGNVIAEAMVVGLPVISADCPSGPREIIAPGTVSQYNLEKADFAEYGVLMPLLNKAHSEKAVVIWADTLKLFLHDEQLIQTFSSKSKRRIQDFTRDKLANKWLNVIDALE